MSRPVTVHGVEQNVDPVCGMVVAGGEPERAATYRGHRYHFCAETCRLAFQKAPETYLGRNRNKKKGWWGRYLDRVARVNKQTFGPGGPCCN